MRLDPELLEILACPACSAALDYREKESLLACVACRREYAVVDGIPNMLVDQAKTP